jgi:hypothetical protein
MGLFVSLRTVYTYNIRQGGVLRSLSYFLLLHPLGLDSCHSLHNHLIHAAVFRSMRLLTATHKYPCTLKAHAPESCMFAARAFPLHSLHSFSLGAVYPLSMFVLACAACYGFVFVMVFAEHTNPTYLYQKPRPNTRV